jgi:hypothetical protein
VVSKGNGQVAMGRRQKRAPARNRHANREAVEEAVVLTW